MIRGIGVDLCDIERMKKAVARGGFREKIFSAEEIEYAESMAAPESHYAAAFAAREALAKAGGWGLAKMGLDACSVRRTEHGPEFVFSEKFTSQLRESGATRAFLSLSHENGMAVAMVVLEGE